MGFIYGLLMFIASYLILGPIMMSFYTAYNQKNSNKKTPILYGIGLLAIYIAIWIPTFCMEYFRNYLAWLIIGAILGLICAIVTFNKNKTQTLIDIETKKTIKEKLNGTELFFNEIIKDIKANGIDYISEDNPIPYICTVMRFFDKSHVEWLVKEFNPNLNIICHNENLEITPLDLMGFLENTEMFDFLIKHGANSANYYQLCMMLIDNNSYDMLNLLLTNKHFDINKPLCEVIDKTNYKFGDDINLLDFAIDVQSHEKIITLLKTHGAQSTK